MSNDKYSSMSCIGKDASLNQNKATAGTLKAKLIKVPMEYVEAHKFLKTNQKTALTFSAYIVEALREKLEKDGAL